MGLFGAGGLKSAGQSVAQTVSQLAGQAVSMLSLTLTQATGQTALLISNAGARLRFSAAGTDFFTSDGSTQIRANGTFVTTNQLSSESTILGAPGTAGASGQGRVVYRMTANGTPVGSGADTTEDNLMTYSLPAGAASDSVVGTVRVTAWGDGVSTADTTTVKGYFGATVVLTKVLVASQTNTWWAQFHVISTGASAQVASGYLINKDGGGGTTFSQGNTSPAETVAGAITIKFTGQRTVSSVANSVRQLGMIVEALS
jgi:hypothetical protein